MKTDLNTTMTDSGHGFAHRRGHSFDKEARCHIIL
jgi:hypothetical protein